MPFRAFIKRLTSFKHSKVAPLFVLVSLFIWFTSALSEQHTAKVPIYLNYTDVGNLQYLEKVEPEKINVLCTGNGFRLMWARIFPQTLSIVASEIKEENEIFLLHPVILKEYVENHFNRSFMVNVKNLSTIQTPIRRAVRRKLAVRMADPVALKAGYDWISNYVFSPDSLYVSGAATLVNNLEYAYLSHNMTSPISENFDKKCDLVSNVDHSLKWSQAEVRVQRSVARFTEHSLRVPIEVIQQNNQVQEIQLIPRYAEVFFSAPLGSVKQIKPTDFRVVCDYQINSVSNVLPLAVLESPDQVRILRVSPTEVQFLVRK